MIAAHQAVYTGVPPIWMDRHRVVTEPRMRSVSGGMNCGKFRVVTRMLGFLTGLQIVATNFWGLALLLPSSEELPSITWVLLFSTACATLTALVFWAGFALFCRLVNSILRPELMKVLETQGPLWALMGSILGNAVVDAYLLPPRLWWCSFAILLTLIGNVVIVVRMCTKVQKPLGIEREPCGGEALIIV